VGQTIVNKMFSVNVVIPRENGNIILKQTACSLRSVVQADALKQLKNKHEAHALAYTN